MIPQSTISVLVQAFLFQLLNTSGGVVGQWGPITDPFGIAGYGLTFTYADNAPMTSEDDAGILVSERASPGFRGLWLAGPRANEDGPPRHIPYVGLYANSPDLIATRLVAGNPDTQVGSDVDAVGFEAQRDGGPGAPYLNVLRMAAGGVLIEMVETSGAFTYAVLRDGTGGTSRPIVTVENLAWSPTPLNVNFGGAGAVQSYRATSVGAHPSGRRLITLEFVFALGAGGGVTGDIQIAFPAGISTTFPVGGHGYFQDVSAAIRYEAAIYSATGAATGFVIRPVRYNGAAAGLDYVVSAFCTAAIPFVWAAGDIIVGSTTFAVD